MNSETLSSMALGLHTLWRVQDISFAPNSSGREELHLRIGFPAGSRFPDAAGQACPVHDTVERCWLVATDAHPLIASSVFHYGFEFIHPFAEGNGRQCLAQNGDG